MNKKQRSDLVKSCYQTTEGKECLQIRSLGAGAPVESGREIESSISQGKAKTRPRGSRNEVGSGEEGNCRRRHEGSVRGGRGRREEGNSNGENEAKVREMVYITKGDTVL